MFQLSLVQLTARLALFIALLFSCAIFSAQTASDQFALTHVAVIDTRDGAIRDRASARAGRPGSGGRSMSNA